MKLDKYKTWLFDWDGTIAKTLDIWLEVYKHLFSERGIELDDKTIATQVFGDWNGPEKLGVKDPHTFDQQLIDQVEGKITDVTLFPGVIELLQKLKQNNRSLALVTSSIKQYVHPVLEKNNLDNLFATIIDGKDVQHHKPEPEALLLAMKNLHAEPETTVMVGDSASDLGAANAAGIDSILFYPPEHQIFYSKETLQSYNPNHTIENFSEISL